MRTSRHNGTQAMNLRLHCWRQPSTKFHSPQGIQDTQGISLSKE